MREVRPSLSWYLDRRQVLVRYVDVDRKVRDMCVDRMRVDRPMIVSKAGW